MPRALWQSKDLAKRSSHPEHIYDGILASLCQVEQTVRFVEGRALEIRASKPFGTTVAAQRFKPVRGLDPHIRQTLHGSRFRKTSSSSELAHADPPFLTVIHALRPRASPDYRN